MEKDNKLIGAIIIMTTIAVCTLLAYITLPRVETVLITFLLDIKQDGK